jgi:alanine racemase
VQVGDTVVLFGTGERDEATVLEWADALDTIGEEIVCRVGSRVHRVYEGHSVEGRVAEYLRGDRP